MSRAVIEGNIPEQSVTCKQIGAMFGLSEEYVRAACHRCATNHPVPHIKSGNKRPVIKIRPSVFSAWYEEEELRYDH